MQRATFLLLIVFLAGSCATTGPITGPGGVLYNPVSDDTIKIRLAVPETWESRFVTEPQSMFLANSPDQKVKFIVMLDPMTAQSEVLFNKILQMIENRAPNLERESLTGTVSGRPAKGLRISPDEGSFTIFAVDHDRGIYVIIMAAENGAAGMDREALDFMFDRLQILEEE